MNSLGVIEVCANNVWVPAQTCSAGEACIAAAGGPPSCAANTTGCTGLLCNGACVPNDEKNCGACGHDCTAAANVTGPAKCEAGACVITATSCQKGFAHCTSNPDEGCETKVSTELDCGKCHNKCLPDSPICAPSPDGSGYACSTGCGADAPLRCGMSCTNPMSDPEHCGSCEMVCPTVQFGRPVCEAGKCTKSCNAGYHQCGDMCAYDKSPETCGPAACEPCPAPTNSKATCDGTKCGFECIRSTDLKCADGCHPSDDSNCGMCGNDCARMGKRCDGRGACVQCLSDGDCKGSAPHCIGGACKACDPSGANTCGSCKVCSPQGACVNQPAGMDAFGDCDASTSGTTCYDGQCNGLGGCRTSTGTRCYRDSDSDGYGDRKLPTTSCSGSCPAGYVENDDDCADGSPEAHPGQTKYYTMPLAGTSSYDWNCDGQQTKEHPEWMNETCQASCSDTCKPNPGATPTPCGTAPNDCPENPCPDPASGGNCIELKGFVVQGCN